MRSLSRQYVYLATFGIKIHGEHTWRVAVDWPEQHYYPRGPVRFHTTQDRVWVDSVVDKQRQILIGVRLPVTVTSASEFGASSLWICNGHHALAAYLDLGRRPLLRFFQRAATSGYAVSVPRFNAWAPQ